MAKNQLSGSKQMLDNQKTMSADSNTKDCKENSKASDTTKKPAPAVMVNEALQEWYETAQHTVFQNEIRKMKLNESAPIVDAGNNSLAEKLRGDISNLPTYLSMTHPALAEKIDNIYSALKVFYRSQPLPDDWPGSAGYVITAEMYDRVVNGGECIDDDGFLPQK